MALLDIDRLSVRYRSPRGLVRAVDDASFAVEAGQIVGLVGESGCGKTTVARSITRVVSGNAEIAGGAIRFEGRDLLALPARAMAELRWRAISFIPQTALNALDPVYRVGDQLKEILTERGGLGGRAARSRAAELYDMVGLSTTALRAYPHQYSGGMRQRAAIAFALALKPRLVIADEPVTALDVIVQRQVLDLFATLSRQLDLAVVLVTHDIGVVAYLCDRLVVMYAGQVVEQGGTADVLSAPVHPYTMGLFNAFPDFARAVDALVPIEGAPPDLVSPPAGCRFEPRCPFAQPVCLTPPPVIGAGRPAACWRTDEAAALRRLARAPETWAS